MKKWKTWAAMALAVGVCAGSSPVVADDRLTLRVNDTDTRPGDLAAVVVRTYSSRPVDQGEICFRSAGLMPLIGEEPEPPLLTLEAVEVFSTEDDVHVTVTEDTSVDPPIILVGFDSPSATINDEDGPLAVLFFRISEDAPVDERIELDIDLEETQLTDPNGQPIEIRPRAGEIRVREIDDEVVIGAGGDETEQGSPLELGAETSEAVPLDSGQVTFLLPPELRDLPRTISFDPRHGNAEWTVTEPQPGRVVVAFTSIDGTLNRIPGTILRLTIDTLTAEPGTSAIALDPSGTTLTTALGDLALEFESGQASIFGNGFFAGGFELGDFSSWSSTAGVVEP